MTASASDFDPHKIDLMTEAPDGTITLLIIQDQPWSGRDAELSSLKQKIFNYVRFALGGQMSSLYPNTVGRPWRIVIDTYFGKPSTNVMTELSHVGDGVRADGGDLILHSLRPPTAPGAQPTDAGAWRIGTGNDDGVAVTLER